MGGCKIWAANLVLQSDRKPRVALLIKFRVFSGGTVWRTSADRAESAPQRHPAAYLKLVTRHGARGRQTVQNRLAKTLGGGAGYGRAT